MIPFRTRQVKAIKYGRSLTDEKNVVTVETYVHYYIVYCYYMWLPDYVCL